MEKFKSYAGQVVVVFAGALLAIWAYDQLNKPKTKAPAAAPAPTS